MRIIVSIAAMLLLAKMSIGAEVLKLRHFQSVYADDKGAGFRSPEGVGCDGKGHILVADSGNGRLVRFTLIDGKAMPDKEIKAPELSFPVRVHTNSKGEIFALDGRQKRVVRFSPGGGFLGRVDAADSPPPSTVVPRSFDIGKDDSIYLLDVFGGRVLILTPEGKFAKKIDFPAGYEVISDLAVDGKGTVFLIDSVKAIVYVAAKDSGQFSPLTESMKERMKFPATIATDAHGNIYLADKNGGDIYIVGPDGSFKGEQLSMGWKEGQLRYPCQLCVNDKGEVFVADRDNNRVQMFSTVR
ncbi:MAG: NHL repeat-containing protein [Desulfobacteria bacterium]